MSRAKWIRFLQEAWVRFPTWVRFPHPTEAVCCCPTASLLSQQGFAQEFQNSSLPSMALCIVGRPDFFRVMWARMRSGQVLGYPDGWLAGSIWAYRALAGVKLGGHTIATFTAHLPGHHMCVIQGPAPDAKCSDFSRKQRKSDVHIKSLNFISKITTD